MAKEVLIFKSTLDDSQFERALSRMQGNAAKTGSSIASSFRSSLGSLSSLGGGGGMGGGGILAALGGGGAAGVIAATVAGLVGIAKAGDDVNQSFARINSATGNMDATADVMRQLQDLTKQTGVSANESAKDFSRFAIAGRQIGASNDDIVKLIATIQKAGIVSGSSTEELQSATTQLGQALASGKFQGDELRSVLENMPLLAESLAKKLNVSVGELREMGQAGTLTADKVFPALLQTADEIDAKFQKMPQSLGRSFTAMTQQFKTNLAFLDREIGLSKNLSKFLNYVTGIAAGQTPLIGPGGTQLPKPKSKFAQSFDRVLTAREVKNMQEEHDAVDKMLREEANFNKEIADIQRTMNQKYMSDQEKIAENEKRIAHLKEMQVGNDATRSAELGKQVAELQAQTFELRVQQRLMSPSERRQQHREDLDLQRAVRRVNSDIQHDAKENERRRRTGARLDRHDPVKPAVDQKKTEPTELAVATISKIGDAFKNAAQTLITYQGGNGK